MLRNWLTTHKRETKILVIMLACLVIFCLDASTQNPNHKYDSHIWPVLLLLGFQLIYAVGIGCLFAKATIKNLLLALSFHIALLYFMFFSGSIIDDLAIKILDTERPFLPIILLYSALFASMVLALIGAVRLVRWGLVSGVKSLKDTD